MAITAIIGTVVALLFIALALAIFIFVVRSLSRPSSRPSPSQSNTAGIDPGPADTSLPTSAAVVQPFHSPAAPTSLPYASIPHLLTAAEGDFFAALQAAAPAGMLIFAQVRLANLVEVQSWAKRDKTHWYKIQAKCVDFVLCEPHTYLTRLVIELDDSSHNHTDRRERDAFVDDVLAAAGLPILHVRWQRRYDPRDLTQQIAIKLPSAQPTKASWVPASALSSTIPTAPLPSNTPVFTSMRRACGQCQAQLGEQSKFCSHCGAVFAVVS
jgi:very-short-patch-repair endonuclease